MLPDRGNRSLYFDFPNNNDNYIALSRRKSVKRNHTIFGIDSRADAPVTEHVLGTGRFQNRYNHLVSRFTKAVDVRHNRRCSASVVQSYCFR